MTHGCSGPLPHLPRQRDTWSGARSAPFSTHELDKYRGTAAPAADVGPGTRLRAALPGLWQGPAVPGLFAGQRGLQFLWRGAAPPPRRRCAALPDHHAGGPHHRAGGADAGAVSRAAGLGALRAVAAAGQHPVPLVPAPAEGRHHWPAMGQPHARFRRSRGSRARTLSFRNGWIRVSKWECYLCSWEI